MFDEIERIGFWYGDNHATPMNDVKDEKKEKEHEVVENIEGI